MLKMFLFHILVLVFTINISQSALADGEIAILLKSTTHPYWQSVVEGFEDTARKHNIGIILQATSKPNDVEGQLNICETILLQKPEALIVATINPYNLVPCLKKFQAADIPIIDIDGNLNKKIIEEVGLNVAFSVTSDNYAIGKKAAEYLKDAKGKILILEGLPGSFPSIGRSSGFQDHMPEGLELVAALPGDWDMMKGANIARDTVTQHPDLKYIFSVSDGMGVGAAEAMYQIGRTDIVIVSVDGQPAGVKAIKNGRMKATVAQLPYLMGQEALLKMKAYLDSPNEDVPFYQYVPLVVLDQDVLSAGTDPLLEYVR